MSIRSKTYIYIYIFIIYYICNSILYTHVYIYMYYVHVLETVVMPSNVLVFKEHRCFFFNKSNSPSIFSEASTILTPRGMLRWLAWVGGEAPFGGIKLDANVLHF